MYAHGPCEAARGAWGLALAVTLLASAGGAAAAWVELDSARPPSLPSPVWGGVQPRTSDVASGYVRGGCVVAQGCLMLVSPQCDYILYQTLYAR